jgi:hypothetical protein
MSAGRKHEIAVDTARMATLLFASLIDEGHTDHEILTMREETLRSLREKAASTAQTATQIAVALATDWNKKS